jgi:hypothetical protein
VVWSCPVSVDGFPLGSQAGSGAGSAFLFMAD